VNVLLKSSCLNCGQLYEKVPDEYQWAGRMSVFISNFCSLQCCRDYVVSTVALVMRAS